MKLIDKKTLVAICCSILMSCSIAAIAADGFVVKDIKVNGLHRVSLGTVLNYLPVQVGGYVDSAASANILRTLYDTGFFQNVELDRSGNTLVVNVVERATIGDITVTGNKDIPTDKLNDVLKQMGLVKGQVFQSSTLEELKQQLKQEYISRGKYNALITTNVAQLTENRVAVKITISEGRISRIKEINIIGNHAFSQNELLKQFTISSTGIFTFITKKDQYSKDSLDASLEALRSYYMNRGYIKFKVDSTQVLLAPDKKSVYINIKITEGPKYYFSGYKLTGKLIVPEQQLASVIKIKKGDTFSRKVVTDAIDAIGLALGNIGYGFPVINAEPTVDENQKTVFVTFVIQPGRHVYVRRINFHGNTKTSDYVLRRAVKQNEGGLLTLSNVKESERQLRLLGYLKNVSVKTTPVEGSNNQVDLNVNVEEAPSAEATASVGYGTNGPEFNAAFNQHNFMGTGRSVGVNFNTSYWGYSYSLSYYNPYYTDSGIGRGFNVYYSTVDPSKLDISTYTSDKVGGTVNYNIPLSNNSSWQLGYGFEHLAINSIGNPAVSQLQAFTDENGTNFNEIRLTTGWNWNDYDRRPFPTRGINIQTNALVALPASSSSLTYYKVGAGTHGYYPVMGGFILTADANIGYGNTFNNEGLPFFEHYYAGGIAMPGEVRGFENYSLGPQDQYGNSLGGNFLVSGSAGVILPYPLSRESVRTTVFVDGGNVYDVATPADQSGTDAGPLRYSAGVSLDWRSPFGPLSFSLAMPLNKQQGDDTSVFQFTVASGF